MDIKILLANFKEVMTQWFADKEHTHSQYVTNDSLNSKSDVSHNHGNLTNDGKVTTTSNDTFQYFVGIGNSTNSLYKSQYLRADKIKDINAHNNISSNANDTQDTINTKINDALVNLTSNKEDKIYRIVGTEVSSPSSNYARLHCGTLPFDSIIGKIIVYVVPNISTLSESSKALLYGSYPSGSETSTNIKKSNNEDLTIGEIRTGDELLLFYDSSYWRLIGNSSISNKEDKSNKVTSISSSSTDIQYPSAKLVYDQLLNFVKKNEVRNNLTSTDTQLPLSAKQGKELKTLVDSKANSNHTHDNISDTGWQEVIFESGYAKYGDPVRYRRIGKVVHIEGIIKNTSAFTPNETAKKVATISDIYCRPQYIQYGLMQGTGANKFLLSIHPNGNISVARYGTTVTNTQVGANSWLHCNLTWMVETENVSYVTSFDSNSGFTYYYPDGISYNQGNPLPAPFKLQKDNGEGIANQSIKFYIDNTLKDTQTTDNNGYVLFEIPWATASDTNNTHTLRIDFNENAPYRPCTYTWTVGQNNNDAPIIA